jgi:hypothetical protein
MTTTASKFNVTETQMSMAHRIVDLNVGQVFFQVESSKQDGTEYIVRYDRTHRVLTCTCPCGQEGFRHATNKCWHVRASLAAAQEYKQEQERLMHELSAEIKADTAPYTVQTDETSSSLDGVKFETAPSGRLVPMR